VTRATAASSTWIRPRLVRSGESIGSVGNQPIATRAIAKTTSSVTTRCGCFSATASHSPAAPASVACIEYRGAKRPTPYSLTAFRIGEYPVGARCR
jgi:hypothetical protein